MRSVGRLLTVVLACAFAAACALVFLPVAAAFDPLTREAGALFSIGGILAVFESLLDYGTPDAAILGILDMLRTLFVGICAAPVILAALIGEMAHVRSIVWYVPASAILAAAMPQILRAAHKLPVREGAAGDPAESRFLLLFLMTGAVAGLVYWLIAGRNSGRDAETQRTRSNG